MFLVFVIAIPLTAFLVTYGAGRWLGVLAGRICFLLSLCPFSWACWQFFATWGKSNDGMALGISGMAVMMAFFLTGCSGLGLLLARRRPQQAEAGTGLSGPGRNCAPKIP